jgi:hypothetical protein
VISAPYRFLRNFLLAGGLFLLACCATVQAQVTAGVSPGLNAALVRLFSGVSGFTAQLEIRMLDAKGVETLNAPMRFSFLEGKMRGELDVAKLKSQDLPPLTATAASTVGLDHVVTLVRPDKQETYLLYPSAQACVVTPIDAADVAALKQPAKLTRTPLGRETVDGHPCIKSRVVITEGSGRKYEATVWGATDLKDFPVKVQTVDGTDVVIMHFQQVRFERPDGKQFDLPAGTAKYDDASQLTRGVLKKLLGGGSAK